MGRCGGRFFSNHEKRYCSEGCLDEAVSFEREAHPNYSGGKSTAECRICGAEFDYYPGNKEGHYCSVCVGNEQWRYRPQVSGANNARWNGGKRELTCSECGATVRRHPWNITSEHVFCSPDCQYEWLSETFTGEGHPNWKGGTQPNYGRGWRLVRRRRSSVTTTSV